MDYLAILATPFITHYLCTMTLKQVFTREINNFLSVDSFNDGQLRANFGVSVNTMIDCWRLGKYKKKTRIWHLLSALVFLKTYDNEHRLSKQANVHRHTFRKYLWPTVMTVSKIYPKVVSINQYKLPHLYCIKFVFSNLAIYTLLTDQVGKPS